MTGLSSTAPIRLPDPDDQRPPTTVACPNCGEDVVPVDAERPVGAARLLAFACPKCHHETPFAFLSARGVRLRDRLAARRTERGTTAARDLSTLAAAYRRELRRLDPTDGPTLLAGSPGPDRRRHE